MMLLCLPLLAGAQKQADDRDAAWRYELRPTSVGTPGQVVVKVWSVSGKPDEAVAQAGRNAVHGVIFRGVPAGERVPARRPLVSDPDANADFWTKFFAERGEYRRFVTLTSNSQVADGDVLRLSNEEYRVGVLVSVAYNDLRKYLEEQGIVKAQ